jgi:DNA replication protein DnaC
LSDACALYSVFVHRLTRLLDASFEHWHDIIGDPTLGDAILDRLVHNAHRLQLSGESMRKQNARNQTLEVNSNP